MDVLNALSPTHGQPDLPHKAQANSSGITLVLPSLKTLKSSKNGKKSALNRSSSHLSSAFLDSEKKLPRPLKLKPLKEVLAKLIVQIKRKDDYAFFLRPVNSEQVPGYTDVIKHPMDFGTMTTKVERGRYRSLEDFASDLRLVTTNAKTFNPLGSIYYTEAERIEAWALDHIAKAAPTVIQYETDWNIDVEKDDDIHMVDIDNDDDSMDVESVHDGRSASVVSQPVPGPSRRGPRGPYKKGTGASVAESVEPEGRLPGAKDGLGAFPPCSDWARTMLQLKLKGKRYRTKKERMRIEKEGPPVLPEGSLDYTEMEDPFSVVSFFVPDPPTRPFLTPLYPPVAVSSQPQISGQSTPVSQSPRSTFPAATTAPLSYTFSLFQTGSVSTTSTLKRRYWTTTRNPVSRAKGKEKDDDVENGDIPVWQTPREAHATDFGSFALLAGELAQEMRRRGISVPPGTGADEEQNAMLDVIRNSLDSEVGAKTVTVVNGTVVDSILGADALSGGLFYTKDYWSLKRAAEAEEYVRDVVYGGVDGLAYVRSLSEFVTTYQSEDSPADYRTSTVFGVPLAQWVEREIIQPLTEGRHGLLQQTANQLSHMSSSKSTPGNVPTIFTGKSPRSVTEQVYLSLNVYPTAMVALSALLQIQSHKIDMGALIKTPEELYQSEEEWAGKVFKERQKQGNTVKTENASDVMEVEEEEASPDSVDQAGMNLKSQNNNVESLEELLEVLEYVAGAIVNHDQVLRKRISSTADQDEKSVAKAEEQDVEDPTLRNIRLNLLALAKRAPLDTIARLPKDLVPEHIRRFVPTLGGSA